MKFVFWFRLKLLYVKCPILRRIERDMVKKIVHWSSCKVTVIILMDIELSWQVYEKLTDIKFHYNLSSASWAVPCGRTDRRTEVLQVNNHFFATLRNPLRSVIVWKGTINVIQPLTHTCVLSKFTDFCTHNKSIRYDWVLLEQGVHPSDSVNCTVRLSYKSHALTNNLHWSNTLLVIASNEVRNLPKVYYIHTSILKMEVEGTI